LVGGWVGGWVGRQLNITYGITNVECVYSSNTTIFIGRM